MFKNLFSVTQRVKNVHQPFSGYIPVTMLRNIVYNDGYKIVELNSRLSSIQGMAVDYLSRFLNGTPKEKAFQIPLKGASLINEMEKADKLLSQITGLDRLSIISACQLVGYDVVVRNNIRWFIPVENIHPDEKMIQNIIVLVNRCLRFFKENGTIILEGFTFLGAYNGVISSGDGDFLTCDTLWDLKVSKRPPSSYHTLQILVYYILGVHSIHSEFKNIRRIGIFNPLLNISYTVDLNEIPDKIFMSVSRDVICYNTPLDENNWRSANGTCEEAKSQIERYVEHQNIDTGFSPYLFNDGIYDITIEDYWSYYRKLHPGQMPNFYYTERVKFIKNKGYHMFISISHNGTESLLRGGALRKLEKPLQYYYKRLPEYANTVINKFSKYWDAIYSLSNELKFVSSNNNFVDDKQSVVSTRLFSGRVHGCIVDIDFFNHIFLNPYDGSIVPYNALATDVKYVYKNVKSLLADKRPEAIPAFNRKIEEITSGVNRNLIPIINNDKQMLTIFESNEIDTSVTLVEETEMYKISNRIKQLQEIYDHNLIVVWYDELLPNYELEEYTEIKFPKLESGFSQMMRCGMIATVIEDSGFDNVTVRFDDGTILENCCRRDVITRKLKNPSVKKKKTSKKVKSSYVGMTRTMNCGLKATVIEDFGCNNITIRFEDGFIKKKCRRDKFREGKISNKMILKKNVT